MLESKRLRDLRAMKEGAKRYGSLENANEMIKYNFKNVLGREQMIEAQTVDQAWEFLAELQGIPVGDVKKDFMMMDAPVDGKISHGLSNEACPECGHSEPSSQDHCQVYGCNCSGNVARK